MADVSMSLDDNQLRALYAWVDKIPLSRAKRNLARDFSDGVLIAEVVASYFPHFVELHNYTPANSIKQKMYNYETLNNKVLRKLGIQLTRKQIEDMCNCVPGMAETVLFKLQQRMAVLEKEQSSARDRSASTSRKSSTTPRPSVAIPKPSVASIPVGDNRSVASMSPVARSRSSSGMTGRRPETAPVDQELLREKEQQIRELQEQVIILELKVAKLEQLVRFKDNKIQKLQQLH